MKAQSSKRKSNAQNSKASLPRIVVATIEKESPDATTGISLAKPKGRNAVIIKALSATSPFNATRIQAGYEILAINGDIDISSTQQAVDSIKDAPKTVSIVAASKPTNNLPEYYSLYTVSPPSNNGKSLYIRFELFRGSLVRVAYIGKKSPFAKTKLRVGDIVLAVNGQKVAEPLHASRLILTSAGTGGITLLTWDNQTYRENAILQPIVGYERNVFHNTKRWNGPDFFTVGKSDFWDSYQETSFRFYPNGQLACEAPWLHLRTQADVTKIAGDWQSGDVHYDSWIRDLLATVEAKNRVIERRLEALEAYVEDADIGEYGIEYN